MNKPITHTIAICREYRKALSEKIECNTHQGLNHLLDIARRNLKNSIPPHPGFENTHQPYCAYWLGKVHAIKHQLRNLKNEKK